MPTQTGSFDLRGIKTSYDSVEVSGRNIIRNSLPLNHDYWSNGIPIDTQDGFKCFHATGALGTTAYTYPTYNVQAASTPSKFVPQPNQYVAFSADVKFVNVARGTTNYFISLYGSGQTIDGTWQGASVVANSGHFTADNSNTLDETKLNGKGWVRVWIVYRYKNYTYTQTDPSLYARDFTGDVYFKNIKFELGNRATDWTPAPEDALDKSVPIYCRTNSSNTPTALPTVIVTNTSDTGTTAPSTNGNGWTKRHMTRIYASDLSYKYLYTCNQLISVGGYLLGHTDVVPDEGTVSINGADIVAGTVTADQMAANSITIGNMDSDTQSQILNSKILETKTASGSIAHIEDASAYPAINVTADIEPIQSGSGTPSPTNIRPISGYSSVMVNRTGKNLIDTTNAISGLCGYRAGDNINTVVASTRYSHSVPIRAKDGLVVSYSSTDTNKFQALFYEVYDSAGNWVQQVNLTNATSTTQTRTVPANTYEWIRFVYGAVSGSEVGTNITGQVQVEIGSTASAYEPYQGNTYTIDLNGTRYGGTLDVTNGVLTVDRGYTELSEDWYWVKSSSYAGGYYASCVNVDGMKANTPFISSHAKTATRIADYLFGTCYCDYSINFRIMSETSTLQDWKDYIVAQRNNGTPINICYELATPQTISLTAQQIELLQGTNNVWADSGDVSVQYVTMNSDLLALAEQASKSNKFITQIGDDGIKVHPENDADSNYAKIDADGMEVYKGGNSVAKYSDTSRVGQQSTRHIEIKDGGLQVYQDASNVMAHIGYGTGNSASGTATTPYYVLGILNGTPTLGNYSLTEGFYNVASGAYSHAEGAWTVASRAYSHAEGYDTEANGNGAHAEGFGTIAQGAGQTVIGQYNIASGSPQVLHNGYLFIIGNGTGDDARSNAMTVDESGNVDISGSYKVNGTAIDAYSTTTFTPTSGSSYSNYGGCYYEKYGRLVHVHVGVSGLTTNTSTNIFTLPTGYRPSSPMFAHGTGGSWNTLGYLEISTAGVVNVRSQGTYCGADAFFIV